LVTLLLLISVRFQYWWWVIVAGLVLATRIDTGILGIAGFGLFLFTRLSIRKLCFLFLGAFLVFCIVNPYMWYMPMQHLKDLIAEEFSDKKPEITEKNHLVCQAGYDYALGHYKNEIKNVLSQRPNKLEQIVVNGNEAIGLGAIAAGMQFAAIYPMTPVSGVLHTLAPLQEKFNFIFKRRPSPKNN